MENNEEWTTKRRRLILYLKEIGGMVDLRQIMTELEYGSKRELIEDIESIKKSLKNKGQILKVRPAKCIKCGFVFRNQERLKIPSKCPKCKHERIEWPAISL
ncbi:MAG: transcriptional regulator [Promethearchaeota archaeon]